MSAKKRGIIAGVVVIVGAFAYLLYGGPRQERRLLPHAEGAAGEGARVAWTFPCGWADRSSPAR